MSNNKNSIMGLLPGDIIDGQIRVGPLIGYGGQGVVLEVHHLEWDRSLALKLPLPETVNSPRKRAQFIREAETWIRLGVHPNIVRCWFVRKISGLPGLFLDLVKGGSLEDKIRTESIGPGRWGEIVSTLLQVAEGLAHSHQMGLVHRDIKPENILIHKNGQVCLTDFGLVTNSEAHSTESQEVDSSSASNQTQVLGTPRYGAPEQWVNPSKICPATDIYAMGVIFYELLCGRRPFDTPDEKILNPIILIQRHVQDSPPDPREFYADIPQPLVELCLRCLSKDPAGRPEDAACLVDLLKQVHREVNGAEHQRPAPVPGGDRPDMLNNVAVSLYSLGMVEKCREYLNKALMLEADHPECVYNLVQLDRRAGKLDAAGSLQRLHRARADYPLALLCIEEGQPHLATAILKKMPVYRKTGLVYRAEGDALMYQGEFESAAKFYRQACSQLPSDPLTRNRMRMADTKQRFVDGKSYFPSTDSVFRSALPAADAELALSDDGNYLFCATADGVAVIHISESSKTVAQERPATATAVSKARFFERRLMIEDVTSFELWDCGALKLLKRGGGKILATTPTLGHIVYLEGNTIYAADAMLQAKSPISFPPPWGELRKTRACFHDNSLVFLSQHGHVGRVNSTFQVEPAPWPSKIAESDCEHFLIHESGLLVVTTSDRRLAAYDQKTKTRLFQRKIPFSPTELFVDSDGSTIVVSSPKRHGIVSRSGRVLRDGKGACGVDPSARFVSLWTGGKLGLYALHPFRKVRTWGEEIGPPSAIRFDRKGRRAVTVEGLECRVWDVDEDHRIFNRELLLTPGASYEELFQAYESFVAAYDEAVAYQKKGEPFTAFTSIKMARSAPGFRQHEEALKFQWELAKKLKRGGVEALWERLHFNDVSAMTLSANGRSIGIAKGKHCQVYSFDGSSTSLRFRVETASPIVGCQFLSGDKKFCTIEVNGRVALYDAQVGSLAGDKETGVGPIVKIRFFEQSLFCMSKGGLGALIDLNKLAVVGQSELGTQDPDLVYPYEEKTVLCVLESQTCLVNLAKGTSKPGFPIVLESLDSPLSCLATGAGLLLCGFEDGSVVIGAGGKPLFNASFDSGRVTGLTVDLAAALGVSISAEGYVTLFDLNTKETLWRVKFPQPMVDIEITSNGRYLATRAQNSECWLWEVAWAISPRPGPISVEWLPTGLGKLANLFGALG